MRYEFQAMSHAGGVWAWWRLARVRRYQGNAELLKKEFLRTCDAKSAAKLRLSNAIWDGYMALEDRVWEEVRALQQSGGLLLLVGGL